MRERRVFPKGRLRSLRCATPKCSLRWLRCRGVGVVLGRCVGVSRGGEDGVDHDRNMITNVIKIMII